jgi:serine/threonine-protein kinase
LGLPTQAKDPAERAPAPSGTRATQFVAGELVAGRYKLVREIGAGGMGVVWVAHSLALGVDVAIKLIRSGVADVELSSRMAREAQVTAALGHPAIVRVFDFGTTERGEPFLVMELAQGETLAARLERDKTLGAVDAIQLLLPIVDGLRCAHERGVIHRDIKPENVFIARDTLGRIQPKLLDFGIAKLEQHPNVTRLTQVGVVLGSPEYMSPEQARGVGSVDARTDVWALAVLLYEMLTGTVPFKVQNYNALMQAILNEPAVPTVEYGAGDRELWLIVAKGLEKTREKRWASMNDFGEALAYWLVERGITEDACGNSLRAVWLHETFTGVSIVRPWRRRAARALQPNVVAAAGALVVVAIAFFALRSAHTSAPPATANAPPAIPNAVATAPPTAALGITEPAASADSPGAAPTTPASTSHSTSPATKHGAKPFARPATQAPLPSRRTHAPQAGKSIRDFGF